MMQRVAAAAVAVVLALVVAGCGTTLDKEGTVDDLVDSGIERSVAECIVDAADERLPTDVLVGDKEATEEQDQILFDIVAECSGG